MNIHQIETTGQLRECLAETIQTLASGPRGLETAQVIADLAAQINESIRVELAFIESQPLTASTFAFGQLVLNARRGPT